MATGNQLMVYSPQRTAGIGRRTLLPERYGFNPVLPDPTSVNPVGIKPITSVDEALYASTPSQPTGMGVGEYGGGAMGLTGGEHGPGQIGGEHAGFNVDTGDLLGGPFANDATQGEAVAGFLSYANPAMAIGKLGLKGITALGKHAYDAAFGPSASEAAGEALGADTSGFISGMEAAGKAGGEGGYFAGPGPSFGSVAGAAGPAGPGGISGLGLAGLGVGGDSYAGPDGGTYGTGGGDSGSGAGGIGAGYGWGTGYGDGWY